MHPSCAPDRFRGVSRALPARFRWFCVSLLGTFYWCFVLPKENKTKTLSHTLAPFKFSPRFLLLDFILTGFGAFPFPCANVAGATCTRSPIRGDIKLEKERREELERELAERDCTSKARGVPPWLSPCPCISSSESGRR